VWVRRYVCREREQVWRSGWGRLVVLLEEGEVSIRDVRRQIGIGPLGKVLLLGDSIEADRDDALVGKAELPDFRF